MSGWGHTLVAIQPSEMPAQYAPCCSGGGISITLANGCRRRGCCHEPPLYFASYQYITGRSGRTGECERHYCAGHAAKFAKAHKLDLPTPTLTEEDLVRWRENHERWLAHYPWRRPNATTAEHPAS